MIKIVKGNLLDSTESHLCHQCNCVSKNVAGLAKQIFERFPYADTYLKRQSPEYKKAGKISVHGNGEDERFIINMYAQIYPGKPQTSAYLSGTNRDDRAAREILFFGCLKEIGELKGVESLSFPQGIGCGLAGGRWKRYLKMLETFEQETKLPVFIYKL